MCGQGKPDRSPEDAPYRRGRGSVPPQHIHGVMGADEDAIVSIFRAAGDHLLITFRHQDREQQRSGVAVGGVAAGVGGAVGKVRERPAGVHGVVGGDIEEVGASDGREAGFGLKGARVAVEVGAGASRRKPIGLTENVGFTAVGLQNRFDFG